MTIFKVKSTTSILKNTGKDTLMMIINIVNGAMVLPHTLYHILDIMFVCESETAEKHVIVSTIPGKLTVGHQIRAKLCGGISTKNPKI